MEFSGTFEIENADVDDVWLALSDPVMVRESLPGCTFLVAVEDDDPDFDELRERADAGEFDAEITDDPVTIRSRAFEEGRHYAALMELSVGSVNPSFETVVTIDAREKPRMEASGTGSASSSSFEMNSGMELSGSDNSVAVEWWAEADVFGKIAQMGQRVINPVANRVVKKFFQDMQHKIQQLQAGEEGAPADKPGLLGRIVARIKRLFGAGE